MLQLVTIFKPVIENELSRELDQQIEKFALWFMFAEVAMSY